MSASTTASSSEYVPKNYVSPKATFTEEEFLEKHSGKKEEKSDFIKYFFDKMKEKQADGVQYEKKVNNLVKMLKAKKGKFLASSSSDESDEPEKVVP